MGSTRGGRVVGGNGVVIGVVAGELLLVIALLLFRAFARR
jgi:hypothetical protein